MPDIVEGRLTFVFPQTWQALKYDETSFYKKHVQQLGESRCVDIVAFEAAANDQLWLLEVKDYRQKRRSKTEDLFLEIARKVRDTLANLYLAQRHEEADCHDFARLANRKQTIRVVLHLEQTNIPSKLYPPVVSRINAQIKLRQTVRVADPRALFCEIAKMPAQCQWTVTST
jgi:hypothetical protein